MTKEYISRTHLQSLIEPSLLNRMSGDQFEVVTVPANSLVTWNRMDIGFRTLYLELRHRCPELSAELYRNELRAQTMGAMIDPDNQAKDSWDVFQTVFLSIADSIERFGFDSNKTLLPLSSTGSILNGGHRLSAAIVHGKNVSCVYTGLDPIVCNYKYFFDRAVSMDLIERAARQLIYYSENVFLAFLWPSGEKCINQAELLFENVILRSELKLRENGPFNLLYQCYNHMDWIGAESLGYPGLKQKVMECFPDGEGSAIVIAFQASDGISSVRRIKEQIRNINAIGYSSVHITDTKEEALRISDLVFNENGRHYLNYSKPIQSDTLDQLRQIHERALSMGVGLQSFTLDGSWLLELYGIRKASDIDIIASTEEISIYEKLGFDRRDEQLVFHGLTADQLVFDSSNYFILFGIKVVGFRQLHLMKTARGESKDISDLKLMLCFLENRPLRAAIIRLRQRISFFQIKVKRQMFQTVVSILKYIGIYEVVRGFFQYLNRK